MRLLVRSAHALGMEGLKNSLPFLDLPNGARQDRPGALLEQVSSRAQRRHLFDVGVIPVRGEDEHLVAGTSLRICRVASNPLSTGIAMSMTTTAGRSFRVSSTASAAGFRFGNDLEVAFGLQQGPETLANDHVVLNQQDGDWLHGDFGERLQEVPWGAPPHRLCREGSPRG